MTTILRLALLSVVASAPAVASVDPELDNLILSAARYGTMIEGMIHGQPVEVVPVPGGGKCQNVGVIQSASRSRGGPRIQNYAICRGEVDSIDEVSPALPEDKEFRQVVAMTVRGAVRHGGHPYVWESYVIDAKRLTPPDSQGCAQVETVVASEGLLVSHNIGRICP